MPAPAIEFSSVSKVYRRRAGSQAVTALGDVTFTVQQGEICAFLGPNGAGKTTAMSLLMGFLPADAGTIKVLGWPAGDVRAKQQMGFLPEHFAFYGYLTAPQLLRLHRSLCGYGPSKHAEIAELVARVKLEEYQNMRLSSYSRGMMQRIGIAQALVGDPPLLVLDEPTSGLDPASRHEVLQLLKNLKAEGKTVFLSSHILPEVEQIADRVIVIDRGKMIREGRLTELVESTNSVEIVVTVLPAEAEARALEIGAVVEHLASTARLVASPALMRPLAEMLWANGAEIVSINPVTNSLEEVFLRLTSNEGVSA